MPVPPPLFPQSGEIQFQLSLLNLASLGKSEPQVQELEKLLAEQATAAKH